MGKDNEEFWLDPSDPSSLFTFVDGKLVPVKDGDPVDAFRCKATGEINYIGGYYTTAPTYDAEKSCINIEINGRDEYVVFDAEQPQETE